MGNKLFLMFYLIIYQINPYWDMGSSFTDTSWIMTKQFMLVLMVTSYEQRRASWKMSIIMNERWRSWSHCAGTLAASTKNVQHFDKRWSFPYESVSRVSTKAPRTFYKSPVQMVKGKLLLLIFHLHISFPKSQRIQDPPPPLVWYLAGLISNRSNILRRKYSSNYYRYSFKINQLFRTCNIFK